MCELYLLAHPYLLSKIAPFPMDSEGERERERERKKERERQKHRDRESEWVCNTCHHKSHCLWIVFYCPWCVCPVWEYIDRTGHERQGHTLTTVVLEVIVTIAKDYWVAIDPSTSGYRVKVSLFLTIALFQLFFLSFFLSLTHSLTLFLWDEPSVKQCIHAKVDREAWL